MKMFEKMDPPSKVDIIILNIILSLSKLKSKLRNELLKSQKPNHKTLHPEFFFSKSFLGWKWYLLIEEDIWGVGYMWWNKI